MRVTYLICIAPPLFPRPDLQLLHEDPSLLLSVASAGDPGDEDADERLIHDVWIRATLNDRLDQYSTKRSLR